MKTIITLSAAIALSLATNMSVAFGGGWGQGAGNGNRAQMRQARVERILERFDANQDDQITLDEVQALRVEHFNQMDADGNGLASFEEFEVFVTQKKQERQNENAQNRRGRKYCGQRDVGSNFANMDLSGDDQLSLDEFTAIVPLFDKFDADNNGIITTEELNQRPQRRRQ